MSIIDDIRRTAGRVYMAMGRRLKLFYDGVGTVGSSAANWSSLSARDRYRVLRAYYRNNDLYERIVTGLESRLPYDVQLQSLRNPAHQVVEFYPTHLWRGPVADGLAFETTNGAIRDPIEQVWNWSNLGAKKQVMARWFARDGDLFVKVAQNDDGDQVLFQLIDAVNVTDFEKDDRGFLVEIRLDFDVVRDGRSKTMTEVWSKERGDMRVWVHDKGPDVELSVLSDLEPVDKASLTADYSIDFLPFVHAPFIDDGSKRGKAAIEAALDKIDEANRVATRLHKMLFRHNDVTWSLESSVLDDAGRPLPPPTFGTGLLGDDDDESEIVEIGGDRFMKLPSGWKLAAMVPGLNYADALTILQDQVRELERDLPEMTWFRLRQQSGELSGRAIQLLLTEAIARAEEARGNGLVALKRLNMMALTIGQRAGLPGFEADVIGVYENGDFEHEFLDAEIIPIPDAEKAQTLQLFTTAGIPVVSAMRLLKFPAAVVADVEAEIEFQRNREEQQRAQATLQAFRELEQTRTAATDINPPTGGTATAEEPVPASEAGAETE